MNWQNGGKVALPFVIVILCLFGQTFGGYYGVFHELQTLLASLQWMLLVCLVVWCVTFVLLAFSRKDFPLIGLLLVVITWYCIGFATSSQILDSAVFMAGVTLGRGTGFALKNFGKWKMENEMDQSRILIHKSATEYFLVGLVGLLAFASWWHMVPAGNYHGPRWMGLWNNPNIYGMLMGAGVVLAMGLLAISHKSEAKNTKLLTTVLFIAMGMMMVGLFFSYSRGAWLGTTVGLLYLAKTYGKLKWRWVLPGSLAVAVVIVAYWHSTADTDQWYFKRLDLSRPSAQHRVAAWRGALQMMRDHPFGVGWNKAVGVYDKDYSPPEGGAAALTMNSYLMLGTELGLPGLLCFVIYLGLCFRGKTRVLYEECRVQTACLAGVLVFVVAFWFDGGLFDLPTAAVFWILLELGTLDPAIPLAEAAHAV